MYLRGPMVGYPKTSLAANQMTVINSCCFATSETRGRFAELWNNFDADTIAASWPMRGWTEKNS
jgi:hypothetical protein